MNSIEGLGLKTILIVDDEKPIVDILVYNLEKEGYNTLEANDGLTAVEIALDKKPDLILLDIMLPKMDGLTVCKKIRSSLNVPILMLTAKDEEIDKILGLELGADDYITKPFSVRELMARIKANLRKTEVKDNVDVINNDSIKTKKIVVGALELDLDRFKEKFEDEYVLLFSPHYFIANSIDLNKYEGFVINVARYDEINELYLVSDIIMTDYSSVFFDFANLKKPMIFFMYDYEVYQGKLRDFYISLDELPGPIAKNQDELEEYLKKIDEEFENNKEKYKRFNLGGMTNPTINNDKYILKCFITIV